MLTDQQRAREASVQFALILDSVVFVAYFLAAIFSGSVTMVAELVRAVLMYALEIFALLVMRRIHRGRTAIFEFGAGKLEQLVNMLIAAGMFAGAVWIVFDVVDTIQGDRAIGTPAGFALVAVLAAFNVYENLLAWDAVRRAAQSGGSVIMTGQLRTRTVKLVSSFVVMGTLTVAALAIDPVVIATADIAGALFVAGFIIQTAREMLRAGLPDLIDRSVQEDFQVAINRMLARHFNEYERLDRVRTRRSGESSVVVGLGRLRWPPCAHRRMSRVALMRNADGVSILPALA
jgi:divalent metal cation (Fe/Co/Zn/Cd) transporter